MSELNKENQEWLEKHKESDYCSGCLADYYDPEDVEAKLLEMQEEIERLKENSEQAMEYLSQVPLHNEDGHVQHYVEMANNWLSKGAED